MIDSVKIDYDRILREKGLKKKDFAAKLGVDPTNLNRTLDKLNNDLSEIDNILGLLGTSLRGEFGGTKGQDVNERLLSHIETQGRIIENLSKKGDVSMGIKSSVAK